MHLQHVAYTFDTRHIAQLATQHIASAGSGASEPLYTDGAGLLGDFGSGCSGGTSAAATDVPDPSSVQPIDSIGSTEPRALSAQDVAALHGREPPAAWAKCESESARFVFTPMQSLRPNVLYEFACQARPAASDCCCVRLNRGCSASQPRAPLRPKQRYVLGVLTAYNRLEWQAHNAEGRSALHTVASFLTPTKLPTPPLNFVVECEARPSVRILDAHA